MATYLYKDGEQAKVEANRVQSMLASGWSVTNEPEMSEDDTIRELAKEAGIQNWHNRKIETLKEMLGYDG